LRSRRGERPVKRCGGLGELRSEAEDAFGEVVEALEWHGVSALRCTIEKEISIRFQPRRVPGKVHEHRFGQAPWMRSTDFWPRWMVPL
jgi:hypothetical protein